MLDSLIGLIPVYGPWVIFGVVALESAGVPLPGETILVGAALLASSTDQISIITVLLAAAGGAIVGDRCCCAAPSKCFQIVPVEHDVDREMGI